MWRCFPGGSDSKESACNVGDLGSIPGSGRSPGEGTGNPLQYSCLENPLDRGAWQATAHGVTKSRTRLSNITFTFTMRLFLNNTGCVWGIGWEGWAREQGNHKEGSWQKSRPAIMAASLGQKQRGWKKKGLVGMFPRKVGRTFSGIRGRGNRTDSRIWFLAWSAQAKW